MSQSAAFSQCDRSGFYYGEILPDQGFGVFTSVSSYSPGEYFRIPVLNGASYTISTCGAGIDAQITGYEANNTASGTHFFYNDDNGPECSGTAASVDFVPTFTDYARVQVSEYNC